MNEWSTATSTGLNVLWSGSVDVFATSNSAHDVIIPAFVEYLMTVQPAYPYPPNPKVNLYQCTYNYHAYCTFEDYSVWIKLTLHGALNNV